MYRKNIFLLITAAIFLAALAVPSVSAIDYSITGDLKYLTNDNFPRLGLTIDNGKAAWAELNSNSPEETLYYYNLIQGRKYKVASSRYTEFSPTIKGNYIYWTENPGLNKLYQAKQYFTVTRQTNSISESASNQGTPDSGQGYAAWLDNRYFGYTNILIKDMNTGEEYLFHKTETNSVYSLKIDENYVYWIEKGDLYRQPFSNRYTDPELVVKSCPIDYSLENGCIVWERPGKNGYYEIMYKDVSSGTERPIVSKPYDCRHPSISEGIVVYQTYKNGDSDISAYIVENGLDAVISEKPGNQISPHISNERIVWIDKSDGKSNIAYFRVNTRGSPSADFCIADGYVSEGLAPLTVKFIGNAAVSPKSRTSYEWDFGDGTFSTDGEPVHTYSETGNYTVKLTVKNTYGTKTVTKENMIIIGELPSADFKYSSTSGKVPFIVKFNGEITGTYDSFIWDFGDGVGSTLLNPEHNYDKPGIYDVTLKVYSKYGDIEEKKAGLISAAGKPQSSFVYSCRDSDADGRNIAAAFTDLSTGMPDRWLWDFGDGTFSTEQNPVHIYAEPGHYIITFRASNSFDEGVPVTNEITAQVQTKSVPSSLAIIPENAGVIPGDVIQLVAIAKDSQGQVRIVLPEWSVSDNSAASIDRDGKLTALSKGQTTVKAEYMGLSAHSQIKCADTRYMHASELPAVNVKEDYSSLDERTKELIRIFNTRSM